MHPTKIVTILTLSALAASGCVTKGKYDEAVAKTNLTKAELDRASSSLAHTNAQLAQTNAELSKKQAEIKSLEALIAGISKSATQDRASSEANIAALRRRLDDLKAAQAAVEARAALYRQLTLRLKSQIDDGDLRVVIRDGRMVLQLPNDVLFDTGRTELKPAGKKALQAVADVMRSMPARQFQIAGHTDDVPIHNDRFASNWELSSGRALRVVHFLIGAGVNPLVLSAAGYGEVDPVANNDTPAGKSQNRRTEITLQPNIDELVKIPE